MQRDFAWREVGERIQALRVARQMTQAQLAKAARLTQAGISAIEEGNTNPQLTSLARIAAVFGRSVRELVCGVRPSPGSNADVVIQAVRRVFDAEDPLAEDVLIQALHNALRIIESHAAIGWRPKRGKVSPEAQEWSEMVKRADERMGKRFRYTVTRERAPVYTNATPKRTVKRKGR